ncbi:MAG: phosphoribosylamine--glycine ligase [Chloroherpetonaceae bacterium]|nr:phosphoribosylamine--glycine ligase [Chloroherpetonaceae bacterium]MCS7210089.1 phosphoribosylamine--glycine ligase [Chloroherpetonaceae bacterium]MDW8020589.1 phosphoribosylamine--glycine ligase [Chloroherpetonaceae bacterium]MDW8467429.1 phosphoribosylamine--glycine ligase [Chloroherpetonaceae bacterium]
MNVLIIGGGGREHALAWAVAKSPEVEKIFVAPGNGGIRNLGSIAEAVPIASDNIDALVAFAHSHRIDLTIVGPEQPLALGIGNRFRQAGLPIVAPTQEAAQLETSKAFAKLFMQRHGIPTAPFVRFTSHREAREYVEQLHTFPVVVKASGLAAGKGVTVAYHKGDALEALTAIFEKKIFGEAGREVIIEEFMDGEEASVFVLTDGLTYKLLPTAQDHKRIGDGDTGKNTGGMGAYAPAPVVTPDVLCKVETHIIQPTLQGMHREGYPYQGFLYIGLMICNGDPKVVEYNARLGDPETQAILPLLKTPFLQLLLALQNGTLASTVIETLPKYAATVVMASQGYPDRYQTGKVITGQCHFDGDCRLDASSEIFVFHAGTRFENGKLYTAGGRVLSITAVNESLETAIRDAYEAVSHIHFEGAVYRRDIGQKGLARLRALSQSN